jgi:hypothetical protein
MSKESNDAARLIQDELVNLSALKGMLASAKYLFAIVEKVRPQMSPSSQVPGVPRELSALPDAEAGAHLQADNHVKDGLRLIVNGQLMREGITAEERNFWDNVAQLVR